jgi:hypothetical protein
MQRRPGVNPHSSRLPQERDVPNDRKRDLTNPSVARIATGLFLGFVVFSLAVGYVATHTGLLPDGQNSDAWIIGSANTN